MSSGIEVACNVDSTVAGTSDDGFSVMVSDRELNGIKIGAYMCLCNGQRPRCVNSRVVNRSR